MKIYVASSWRNPHQQDVVGALRAAGHDVYDFRNPAPGNTGFAWSDIDEGWQAWTPQTFRSQLQHPIARAGFGYDFEAMEWADTCVLVMPCGRSAHLEAGWFVGQLGKRLFILLDDGEPELMYAMADGLCCDLGELVEVLGGGS
jgi:hypothetical protein